MGPDCMFRAGSGICTPNVGMLMAVVEHLETIVCPNCGTDDPRFWGAEGGYTAVKCSRCGLVYVNPRPKAEEITEATTLGVHRTDNGALDVKARRHPGRIKAYRVGLRRMLAPEISAGKPIEWLDVGAGYGEFIEAVQGVLPAGSSVEGIEPMRPKVKAAQLLGINVREGLISEMDRQYDAISLINVFSHIPDFASFGRQLADRLKVGGILFLVSGNGGDLERRSDYPDRLYLPDHLVFAGNRSLRQMIGRLGFEVVGFEEARVDGLVFLAKNAVKGLLAGDLRVRLPYTSPFRSLFLKARKL